MTHTPHVRPWLLPVLLLLFFASGAAGLVYQVLWTRQLGLVFGVTVYAASTVWASYMAGLALGSYVAGRIGDRARRPLFWFALAETGIGLSALATPVVLEWLQTVYPAVFRAAPDSLAIVTFVRLSASLAVLVVPTSLMGATLPLVVKSALVRGGDFGSRVSLLYGTNTAGAIAGTLLAGLYLIPEFGLSRSFVTAAAVNVGVGALAALAALAIGPARPAPSEPRTAAAPSAGAASADEASPAVRRLVLIVFAVSGFATLALEVVWFRVIVLLVRPTVYGFAVLLATVLFGIAVGSWAVTPLMRRRRGWVATLAALELAMAFAVLYSFVFLTHVPALARWAEPFVSRLFPAYLAYPIVAAVPAILPAALLMGLAFPVGLRVYAGADTATSGHAAGRIGTFYAWNVCGAILGSLAAGFVMLPALGSRASLIAVAAIILVSGLALLVTRPGRVARLAVPAVLIVAFAAASLRVADPFVEVNRVRYPDRTIVWHEEAVQGTVAVQRGPGRELGLYLEGNHQASDTPSMVYVHRRIAHLPLVLHRDPATALVVGLGGGATAGAAAIHHGVDVDVVELSGAVARAARYFEAVNHQVLDRPNVRLRVDDGRNYLLTTDRRYDVVTADLILPIYAGSNNVYSAGYFSLVRRALRPGGLALQWVAGTEAEYKIIMRTFLSVFPHATLWVDGSLMVGSTEPLRLSEADFARKAAMPGNAQALAELGIADFEALKKAYVAGPDEMRAFVGDGPILTDDRPLIEYFLSLPRDRAPDLSGLRGDVMRHVVEPSRPQ